MAPIFNEDSMAEYYHPEGVWTCFLTNEVKKGGKWYGEKHGYLSIPLYVREGSIVAVGARSDSAVYDYARNVTFRVYALKEGETAKTRVYSEDNIEEAALSVSRAGGNYKVVFHGEKPCRVELVNAGKPEKVNGAAFEMRGNHAVLVMEQSCEAEILYVRA